MVSSSNTSSASSTSTTDNKVAADGKARVISSGGGDVTIHQVPDEAFQLGAQAITAVTDTLGKALATTQKNAKTESAQISQMLIKIGLPTAALIFIFSRK